VSRSRLAFLAVATLAAGTTACSAILDWSDFTGGSGEGGSVEGGTDAGLDGDATTADSSTDGPAMESGATDSASPDAVVSCGNGGVCAPAAPSGWTGPVSLYAGPSAAPACSGGASSLFDGMGDLMAPPATCSSCGCGTANASCSDPVVSVYEEMTSCSGTPSSTVTPSASCSTFPIIAASVSVSAPALTGSCPPGTSTPTLTPPSWGTQARACPVTGSSGCSGGASCIAPQLASTSVCVKQPGAATACPSGYPSGPQIFYTGFIEGRGCTACTCSPPGGATCTIASPAIDTFEEPGCMMSDLTLSAPTACTQVAGDFSIELVASPMLTGTPSCSVVVGGGMPTGTATGSGATSFCCLP
jgi:hypothetical protein